MFGNEITIRKTDLKLPWCNDISTSILAFKIKFWTQMVKEKAKKKKGKKEKKTITIFRGSKDLQMYFDFDSIICNLRALTPVPPNPLSLLPRCFIRYGGHFLKGCRNEILRPIS